MLRLSLGRKILLASSASAVLAFAAPTFGQIGGIGGGGGIGGSGVGPSVGPSGGASPSAPAVPNINPGASGSGGIGGSGSGSIGNQGASGAGSLNGQGRGNVGNALQGSGNAAGQVQGNLGNRAGNAAGNVNGQGQGALGNQSGNAAGAIGGQGQGSLGNRAGNAAGNLGGQGQGSLNNRAGDAAGAVTGQAQGSVQGTLRNSIDGRVGQPNLGQSRAFDVTRRGALGVAVNPGNNSLSVSRIHEGSVAQRAGLQMGDQIVSVNGQAVRSHADLAAALRSAADANNATTIAFNRNGQLQNVQVDLSGTVGGAVRGMADVAGNAGVGRPILGIGVEPDAQGLRIVRVNPGSVAQQLQLQPNDRVVSVNGQRVTSSAELSTQMNAVLSGDGQAAIVINRNGQNRTVNHTFDRAASAAGEAREQTENALERGANRLDSNVNPNRQ
jgi:S1-C subfamily serine protease